MLATSVTSKGQITIPKQIRQKLGISKGSKFEAAIVGDHIELYPTTTIHDVSESGFALLTSNRSAVPTDFDPATLLSNDE
ncbi:MAG: AbrB/MazE/SpoVT family DNA-binding domain-containing protein [gamma proteobacterium symbiont of Taylorina sp.]|nr:AbrB/MazE/SpoVT family DNA-binding domain-containing protein [gamma proteobacterium symbiont of Taylorina sp.]